MNYRNLFFAVAIAAGAVSTLPVIAKETPMVSQTSHTNNINALGKSQAVSYGDLDLGHKAGATVLLNRVRLAANQVCGPEPSIDLDRAFRNCVTETMTRAVQQINQPIVSSLFQDKFGVQIDAVAGAPTGVTAATH
ncbi:MAG TPA: UrcA family protein [Alphaproteobacteria bacterium]|nr:UrcA family protein [Alphaproteobacteria bacterium]